MNLLIGFLTWIALTVTHQPLCSAQSREIFILNLEDGFFGCQVNESTEFLQLFEVSRLCDGVPQCFRGSDELADELKCTNNCKAPCQNGVCLDKQCHCNDGFGGCECEMPDENECKYRPCDVFAQCTNTLGSFYCTCLPGYEGNGFECRDINECENPALAAKCVRNAECCNLPAHYVCKCRPGFDGDGYTECRDVDECLQPNICAKGAHCTNHEGNFTCSSPSGFTGDPYHEIHDINECLHPEACGVGALCTNTVGSYTCQCPEGFEGDPFRAGCVDLDECKHTKNPCGEHLHCVNLHGGFECICPPGFTGNPQEKCVDIDECLARPCANKRGCINTVGGYTCECPSGFSGADPNVLCERTAVNIFCEGNADCGENQECAETSCRCMAGFEPKHDHCVDIDECLKPNTCGPHAKCFNVPGTFQCECDVGFIGQPPRQPCKDLDECMENPFPCGRNAKCMNMDGTFSCSCPKPLMGDPHVECHSPCENINCGSHAKCRPDGQSALCICDEGFTFDPRNVSAMCLDINECDTVGLWASGMCGDNAVCTNTPGSFSCLCPPGFSGDAQHRCDDVDECRFPNSCGENAVCYNSIGSYSCACLPDMNGDPYQGCEGPDLMKCDTADNNTCPGNSFCSPMNHVCVCPAPNVGDDCRHPCEPFFCGLNAECMLINDKPMCVCKPGFTGSSVDPTGCVDINECKNGNGSPCGKNAVCKNLPGSHSCECPTGFQGNANHECIPIENQPEFDCSKGHSCPQNEKCLTEQRVCVCKEGFTRDESRKCKDVNECTQHRDSPVCGLNANCHNLLGSYECSCSPLFTGNPYTECVPIDISCHNDDECPANTICLNSGPDSFCGCPHPFIRQGKYCVSINRNCSVAEPCPPTQECALLSGVRGYCVCPRGYTVDDKGGCTVDIDECTELRQKELCGFNGQCVNTPGSYECHCRSGFSGDPTKECSAVVTKCSGRKDCVPNEVCGAPGECQCLPPFIRDGSACQHPCDFMACGLFSRCILTNQGAQCQCERGYEGNPLAGCHDVNECQRKACGLHAICINTPGNYTCECQTGLDGNPYSKEGCKLVEDHPGCLDNEQCPPNTVCLDGECVDPCLTVKCGSHAVCVRARNGAECHCNPGYIASSEGKCISQCDHYLCAKNARCIIDNNGIPACMCQPGFQGLPHAGGECRLEQCTRNEECEKPQECLQGQCKERCQGVVCGLGARCDQAANRCNCFPFFIGDPNLLCVPPIMPPVCVPDCGRNAFCEYGLPNKCVCRPGLTGNPYEHCDAAPRRCDDIQCGANARCSQGISRIDCICPPGFEGSPYLGCTDINECLYGNRCGINAVCVNVIGSSECHCKAGTAGDPYVHCIESGDEPQPKPGDCSIPQVGCECKSTTDCRSSDLVCRDRVCVFNPCRDHTCGPNAFCELVHGEPNCKCLPNFPHGDPSDIRVGCAGDVCDNNLYCKSNEVCIRNNFGFRECIAVCKITQCGPNAVCQAKDHHGECRCNAGFAFGNPNDLTTGCTPVLPNECEHNDACQGNQVCEKMPSGNLACIDPCDGNGVSCGPGARCIPENKRPTCACLDGYYGDPNDLKAGCIPKPPPECQKDNDCLQFEHQCRVDHIGVKKCISPCIEFNCEPKNAECIVVNRKADCRCKPGFSGRPNSREGCRPVDLNECSKNENCDLDKVCHRDKDGILKCLEVCKLHSCGANSVCVPRNHAPTCQCPPGLYIPDPATPNGCIRVECLKDDGCAETHSCVDNKCEDPCKSACGANAICIAQGHRASCSCKAGYTGNPTAECKGVDFCGNNPCHPSAQCHSTAGSFKCQCPPNQIGNPYTEKCHDPGMCPNGDSDCEPTDKCHVDASGAAKCINPCDGYCGQNTVCSVKNHQPTCKCRANFLPSPTANEGCIRPPTSCTTDHQCGNGLVCVDGECQFVCSVDAECAGGETCYNSICVVFCVNNNQCPLGQVCSQGVCLIGCRANSDCSSDKEACIEYKCRNPCLVPGICGANALCDVVGHQVQCQCPPTFIPNPTPVQGCVREFVKCTDGSQCGNGYMCNLGTCRQICDASDKCGFGERCASDRCEVLCTSDRSCQPGQVCVDQHCQAGCRIDGDCRSNEYCYQSSCICRRGFTPTAEGCADENECSTNPCHPSAKCTNTVGSYMCQCAASEYGDPYKKGCRKDVCNTDVDCPPTAVCGKDSSGNMNCIDPCVGVQCSLHATCVVIDHQPYCECPQGYLGDPIDHEIGCYMPECIDHDKCPNEKECYQYKCENPCDVLDCGENGVCIAHNHAASCKCNEGYILNEKGYCVDEDECHSRDDPCPAPAKCVNFAGGYSCQCPQGFHEEHVNQRIICQPNGECPKGDVDCPVSLTCMDMNGISKCINPCEKSICGKNAQCRVVERRAVCFCPARYTGDAGKECFPIECLNSQECQPHMSCIQYTCKDPCHESSACGSNTDCVAGNHKAVCRCKNGFDGDPLVGCRLRIPCEIDSQCRLGETCQNKLCRVPCDTNRACLPNEQCINSKCTAVCSSDDDCPTDKFCDKNICRQRLKCRTDGDCDNGLFCLSDSRSQPDCLNPCEGVICDGRNSECTVRDRLGVCVCQQGFVGNPDDRFVGCVKSECEDSSRCTPDKTCVDHKCINPCSQPDVQCGINAACMVSQHAPVCRCREGYEGDPLQGCKTVDFCRTRPCGERAECQNTPGSYKCVCVPGTVLDEKSGKCRGANECPSGDRDCPGNAQCVTDGRGVPTCRDPCLDAICGYNTMCLVESHRAVCACMPGFKGEPLIGCVRELVRCSPTNECSPGLVCDNSACKAVCGIDRDCASQERCGQSRCGVECNKDEECPNFEICLENTCQLACRTDRDCAPQESCITGQCRNLCESNTACGINAECQVLNHHKHCQCPAGFEGDPNVECRRVLLPCRINENCPRGQTCNAGRCQGLCTTDNDCFLSEKCISKTCHQVCRQDNDCTAGDVCLRGICQSGCRTNEQCHSTQACLENQCRDLCKDKSVCGPNSKCEMVNHRPSCSCAETYVSYPTPNSGCIRDHPLCVDGNHCYKGSACMDTRCIPICNGDLDCGDNEKCIEGRCLITCRRDNNCPEGEICDGHSCVPGCRNDDECFASESCIHNRCRDPCASLVACGTNAQCRVEHHQAVCSCPAGMTGNPNVACGRKEVTCTNSAACGTGSKCHYGYCIAECAADSHCLNNERCLSGLCVSVCTSESDCQKDFACVNGLCQDPCSNPSVCGINAQCKVMNRQLACSCPPGMTGNPRVQCVRVPARCQVDKDCPHGSHCHDLYCWPPCATNTDCQKGEVCHNARCTVSCSTFCPPGHTCVDRLCVPGCADNDDCPSNKKCIQNQCQDPCHGKPFPCGTNADCRTVNHHALCMCPNGFEGEPTKNCVKVGCSQDGECDSDKACINKICQVPCLVPGACGRNAQCRVDNHRKVCSCPLDYSGNPNIECFQDHPCRTNDVCPGNLQCISHHKCGCVKPLNRLSDACISTHNVSCAVGHSCPANQKCRFDLGICVCPRGFTLSPSGDCVDVDECLHKPCGPHSFCTNLPGEFTCTCEPDNFGDPYSTYGCAPMAPPNDPACVKDSDCGHAGQCIGGRCMVQGCEGSDTCEARECTCDTDCPVSYACLRGRCADPCTVGYACGQGSLCISQNHQAFCACPQGFYGDPRVRCVQVACRRHTDCPEDALCQSGACVNPCFSNNPCMPNAICRMENHGVICICPPNYDGPPAKNCFASGSEQPTPQPHPTPDYTPNELQTRPPPPTQRPPKQPFEPDTYPPTQPDITKPSQTHRPHSAEPSVYPPFETDSPFTSPHPLPPSAFTPDFTHRPPSQTLRPPSETFTSEEDELFTPTQRPLQPVTFPEAVFPPFEGTEGPQNAPRPPSPPPLILEPDYPDVDPFESTHTIPPRPDTVSPHKPSVRPPSPTPTPSRRRCYIDHDCPLNTGCIDGQCINPCSRPSVCGTDAICKVASHRAMCTCPKGYRGDPKVECSSASAPSPPFSPATRPPRPDISSKPSFPFTSRPRPTPPRPTEGSFEFEHCSTDASCPEGEACIDRECRDPCLLVGVCADHSECRVEGHRAVCTCLPGYEGDASITCFKATSSLPSVPPLSPPPIRPPPAECDNDSDCPAKLACSRGNCIDPCALYEPCAPNAHCSVRNHQAVCRCPPGYEGNALVECIGKMKKK